jgi:hypothetical protein
MRDTIDMAREAGAIHIHERPKEFAIVGNDSIKAFEALVRADEREQGQKWFDAVTAQNKQLILAEREACAKVCDAKYEEFPNEQHDLAYALSAKELAAAIRNRGNT